MALSDARQQGAADGARPAADAAAAAEAVERLRPDTLTERDIDAGLALSDAAGWNQTGDDWALFIRHGRAIGLRDAAGRWVATAAALPYGHERGWISMVLVAEAWRHRGLASRLLDECVAHLRGAGIVPVLDATPAGAAVYRRLGFVAGFEIDRWERPALSVWTVAQSAESPSPMPRSSAVEAPPAGASSLAEGADLDVLMALDRDATGLDRRFLLASFLSRPETRAWRADDGRGFVVARSGRRATQIGPLVAGDPAQAAKLLDIAIAAATSDDAGRPIFLDLPRAHLALAQGLEHQGFARQRPFVRMSLGASEAPRLGGNLFVLAGPEFG
ncbi:MAG: GNAT family N-acetyltransferase [Caldimonas sp.]